MKRTKSLMPCCERAIMSEFPTITAKDHMARVAGIGCVLCWRLQWGYSPSVVHHLESVRDDLSDYLTVPLCPEHHQGKTGVHGYSRREFEMVYKLGPMELLALTIQRIP